MLRRRGCLDTYDIGVLPASVNLRSTSHCAKTALSQLFEQLIFVDALAHFEAQKAVQVSGAPIVIWFYVPCLRLALTEPKAICCG